MKTNNPILITGVPRSGATFIARILTICGVHKGVCDKMYENTMIRALNTVQLSDLVFPNITLPKVNEDDFGMFNNFLNEILYQQRLIVSKQWFFKDSQLTLNWRYWHKKYPNAQWVIVRRKTPHIINSCIKTQYMDLMKDPNNLESINVSEEKYGWLWLVHQYEKEWAEMLKEGIKFQEVYPDRLENNDYSKIKELVETLGLTWTDEIETTLMPYFTDKERVK